MILNSNERDAKSMNPEVKNLWIDALNSDKYIQNNSIHLKDGDKFSVLGVLCDLHAKITGNKWDKGWYLWSEIGLPIEVVDWAGLGEYRDPIIKGIRLTKHHTGYIKYGYPEHENGPIPPDTKVLPKSFKRLAKIIKNYL